MLKLIREHTQRKRLRFSDGFVGGLPVGQHSGQF